MGVRKRGYVVGAVVAVWLLTPTVKSTSSAAETQQPTFDVTDLAYLWPTPTDAAGVSRLISAEVTVLDGSTRIWPEQVFQLLLQTAQETTVETPARTFRIDFETFKTDFEKPSTWKLVSFRFDPSAPGGHAGFVSRFGSTPQLRMVFQPVTFINGAVRVHDVTAHVAYSFVKPSVGAGLAPAVPDKATVRKVLDELKGLKAAADTSGAITRGALQVHPALQANAPGFSARVVTFLRRTASLGQLTDLAFMGIDPPEPWIFFAMRRRPTDGAFVRVGPKALVGRSAQMLILRGGPPVVPEPVTTNQPPDRGVSTALLFDPNAANELSVPVFSGTARPLRQDIPDIVANPEISNVFNTDCVSCHTESTRRRALKLPDGDTPFRYKLPAGLSGVDPRHLPTSNWNVRNFGWFQRAATQPIQPTISQRTAHEAADAADFANREYFASGAPNPVPPSGSGQPPGQGGNVTTKSAVASPLTLVMDIKSAKDFQALKAKIETMQSAPPEKNPIVTALNRLGTVHFARFVFLNERQLAVITTYDGTFEDYIDAFVNAIGEVFDSILEHVTDAPRGPVRNPENRQGFLEFVREHDLKAIPPFYSAYPDLKVLDILTLQKKGS